MTRSWVAFVAVVVSSMPAGLMERCGWVINLVHPTDTYASREYVAVCSLGLGRDERNPMINED